MTPEPEAKLSEEDQVMADLEDAQRKLDQLVILRSLESERQRLQNLLLQKQRNMQGSATMVAGP